MATQRSDYDRVELVWSGKTTEVERVSLPFQTIERVNDVSRSLAGASPLERLGEGVNLPEWWPDGWRNKLIWGDNKYALGSLLDEFAGKVDLIYIDPPFATGADFSFRTEIGRLEVEKEPTIIEELAYRDTWGAGTSSFLSMLTSRLVLLKELLAPHGNICVHVDWRLSHNVRVLMDEIFGATNFRNQISWHYGGRGAKSGAGQFPRNHDDLILYSGGPRSTYLEQYAENLIPISQASRNGYRQDEQGRWFRTSPRGDYTDESIERLRAEGRIYDTRTGTIRIKYFEQQKGDSIAEQQLVGDVWNDIPDMMHAPKKERTSYPTEKPPKLIGRLVEACSRPGDLVLDAFVGSGSSLAASEHGNRRWIGIDLGRFAIQTARKRLLDIPDCRPFEILNLGRYERRYWQGVNAGEAIWEYYRFILNLYHAQQISGFAHLHGEKAGRMVHVGATDAPVTLDELAVTLAECAANGIHAVDVLGWEWEMGLNPAGKDKLVREHGVDAHLRNIPREVMDERAVEAGDIHFFELSVADVHVHQNDAGLVLELVDFLPAIDEYMQSKVKGKVSKWSDWIDYWSVDFDYDGETFVNRWQAYRTRKEPSLMLRSDPFQYDNPGTKRIVVKVIDIFGNDTTVDLEVDVA